MRKSNAFGLATLETALALTVTAGFIFGSLALLDYLNTEQALSSLVDSVSNSSGIKPRRLVSHEGRWETVKIDAYDEDQSGFEQNGYASQRHFTEEYLAALDGLSKQLDTKARDLLGSSCQVDCQKLYRTEIRVVSILLNEQDGTFIKFLCDRGRSDRKEKFCPAGNWNDLDAASSPVHRFLRVSGGFKRNSRQMIRDFENSFTTGLSSKTYAFETLSALHGVEFKQAYSDSVNATQAPLIISPLVVVGVSIELDLSASFYGQFMKRLVPDSSAPLVLRRAAYFVPRQEF